MNGWVKLVGVLFIVVGAGAAAVPTGSFSTIAGDRPVDVSVADDSAAFVAVAGTDTVVSQPGDGVDVAHLRNNFESAATIEYEASVDASAVSVENPSDTVTIGPSGSTPISAVCAPPAGGSGTATLQVSIVEADAGNARVTDATLETTVEYDCPGGAGGGPAQPPTPSGPPGDAVAYVDENGNYAYDEGEPIVSRSELAAFDDDEATLVIAAGGDRIEFRNREVDIEAKQVAIGDATLGSNRGISLSADGGEISLSDSTVDSKNGEVSFEGGSITAAGSTVATNREIGLSADGGALTFTDSTIDSKNGEIELAGESVFVDGSTVSTNRGISLSADPGTLSAAGATVDSTNGAIELEGSSIDASGAQITTNTEISLAADGGPLTLTDATVDSTNGEIELSGGSVDADGAQIDTNTGISIASSSGDVRLRTASVTSTNGEIEVESAARILASGAVFDTNVDVSLAASGDVDVDNGQATSQNGAVSVELDLETATLSVDGAVFDDRDGTLTYSPEEAAVSGTPARGSVAAD
ncbi:hypothetical protein [Halobellus rufus]|uniref:hypothetical protein n=1 Tax=Halobellus rufus TaxID=1448860 RepID=UPI0006788DAB|nr:hypothetical protein [Halobellus rufus]